MKKDNCSDDYIDRQMAITHVYVALFPNISAAEKADKALREAPTIDAVPVVRCKDCKHYTEPNIDYCELYGAMILCDKDDFCSHGERRMV